MIIGTAGHIDHGKTALVRALTGVDTDRLPEERRRGITIELGFAPLDLSGLGTVGIVDVPGHEAFVRTMVAGAIGVDVGLLVVAADEGAMPQTREHLAILSLLAVRGGVIAITKCDLADPEWIQLVRDDLRRLVEGTPLHDAPIVETSVRDGRGLDDLRRALAAQLAALRRTPPDDLFRLPVDRAFSVKGTGTVVTGTSWSGRLEVGSEVRLFPAGATARVRGLQSHGRAVEAVGAGERVAVALAGVEVGEVARGSVLASQAPWVPTTRFHAEVALQPGAAPLRPREWLHLHVGTAEVGARVVPVAGLGGTGGEAVARVVTDAPVVLRAGDRFILRRSQPLSTVGGGRVVDPAPAHRRARPRGGWDDSSASRLTEVLRQAGPPGLPVAAIPIRVGTDLVATRSLLESTPGLVRRDDRVVLASFLRDAEDAVAAWVSGYHAQHPLEPGAPPSSVRAALAASGGLVDLAIERLVSGGRLDSTAGTLRQPGWAPRVSEQVEGLRQWVLERLRNAGMEPPSVAELRAERSTDVFPVLRLLEREGTLVAVEGDRYYASEAVDGAVDRLASAMASGAAFTPAQLRDVLGVSRKYLVPFLEFCDRRRITERRGEGRVFLTGRVG